MGSASSRPQQMMAIERPPYGVFKLVPAEEQALRTIHDLLDKLMGGDTLFSLKSVLRSSGTPCDSLFITMSSTLEREFQLLKFPDPLNPGGTQVVAFMPANKYKGLAENPSGPRRIVCEQIGFFALRFVTLVSALAASVAVNPATANVLYALGATNLSSSSGKYNPTFKDPKLPGGPVTGGMRGGEVSSSILRELLNPEGGPSGPFRPVKVRDDQIDERKLYYFHPLNAVVIDTRRDLVYCPLKDRTGVMKISVELYMNPMRNQTRNARFPVNDGYRRNGYRGDPRVDLRMDFRGDFRGDPRGDPRGNLRRYEGGAGRTRRHTRQRRIGGANPLFLVKLYQVYNCGGSCPMTPIHSFIMKPNGDTYDQREYEASRPGNLLKSIPFSDRVEKALSDSSKAGSFETVSPNTIVRPIGTASFSPISKLDESTLKRFESIHDAIKRGSAPANERAFMLASTLGLSPNGTKQTLKTMICEDKLQGLPMTSSVAHSLLQSLYVDLPTGDSDFNSAAECAKVVQRFVSDGLVDLGIPGGGESPTTFQHIKFKKMSGGILESICRTQVTGPRSVELEELKQVFTNTYIQLRDEYDAHIQNVVAILQKIVNFGDGLTSSSITVERIFLEHNAGAQAALNEVTHQARRILAEHYLKVESLYQGVLANLAKVQAGKNPTVPNTSNRLNKSADKLAKEL